MLAVVAFVALAVGVMAVTLPMSCGGLANGGGCPKPTPDVTSPVDGVIVSVDAAGLGDVRGFTLRPTTSPFSVGFVLGTLENPTEFPPSHLAEHQATSQPVRVFFRTENGMHIAYRLEDAAPPGS
jgi:hypothetical protein